MHQNVKIGLIEQRKSAPGDSLSLSLFPCSLSSSLR